MSPSDHIEGVGVPVSFELQVASGVVDAPRRPVEFVDWLVSRHPQVAPILGDHMSFYGELLAHVLFGDVTRHAADLARRAGDDPEAEGELGRLLQDLDGAMLPADTATIQSTTSYGCRSSRTPRACLVIPRRPYVIGCTRSQISHGLSASTSKASVA
jgi:hypothetical protein